MWLPGGRSINLRGTTAIYLATRETYVGWVEGSGTTVTLQARNIAEPDLLAIARDLQPMTDRDWRDLIEGGGLPPTVGPVPDIGPPPGVVLQPPGFAIVPVTGQYAPPCGTLRTGGMVRAEQRAGMDVVCYEIGDTYLDAGDVAGATPREEQATGAWSVELSLTPGGAADLDRLFQAVGTQGRFAVLLDGKLLSAQRVAAVTPGGRRVVTGLDEQTARRLADRLAR